jgi:hypothetical protein
MVCGRDEKKGGVTSLYRAAGESAVEELANIDADGHAVMHDETLHCVSWKIREAARPLSQLDQR